MAFKHGFNPFALQDGDFVPSPGDYINLQQKGVRRQEITGVDEFITFQDLFNDPGIMTKFSIIILGPPSTTGFGKTTLAKGLASAYARWQVAQGLFSPAGAFVHVASTIDTLKDHNIRPGQAIVMDEFRPSDKEQNAKLSEEAMKIMLDVRNIGTIWTRYGDTVLPPTARLFTSNASSPYAWVSDRFPWTPPMARKAFVWVISKPLVQQGPAANNVATSSDAGPSFFNCNLA